jgi:hypothetical protein
MPAGGGLFVPFALEEFIPADSLLVIRVQDLSPRAALAFTDVWSALELRNDAL